MRIPLLSGYYHWLHGQWPAGKVEKLPVVNDDGSTRVDGLWVVGDLAGVPLLKFSADSGARVVQKISENVEKKSASASPDAPLDVVIIGAGVSGMSAALEARKLGLSFKVIEAAERFSTIVNFPKAKPIYTYPVDMTPTGELSFRNEVHPKETLLADLVQQAQGIEIDNAKVSHVERKDGALSVVLENAKLQTSNSKLLTKNVIVAIGRSGNFRMLGVPGENLPKVYNRLHDPKEYKNQNVVVVGGGDSALETAIAIAEAGGHVTLSYRKPELARAKSANIERVQALTSDRGTGVSPVKSDEGKRNVQDARSATLRIELGSSIKTITDDEVILETTTGEQKLPNDAVFTMIGREPPLDFFRKSGVPINGERSTKWWVTVVLSVLIFTFIYHWKKSGTVILPFAPFTWISGLNKWWETQGLFPFNVLATFGNIFVDKTTLLGTMKVSVGEPGFWYSLVYCLAIVFFGLARIRRRKTPYVKLQTFALMAIQVIPLFLLPFIVLPWLGNNGAFESGVLKTIADSLFPIVNYGHGREYWRAFGLILAWPLFIWNVFTDQPMWGWLAISIVQTFVFIPVLIYYFGKGAYCGWICSCGALAETVGDAHRTKMPHGPGVNKWNMVGQVFMVFAFVLLGLRIIAWIWPGSFAGDAFKYLLHDLPVFNYSWFVDLLFAGIIGVAFYFHFSGRVWCRFACPLAALMHIYAKFSKFAIVADKKKCISCNVCTTVCHQGIDVMSFANKGKPMVDVQCVRCSACVQMCPTGVLSFGMIDRATGATTRIDKTPASLVQLSVNGKAM